MGKFGPGFLLNSGRGGVGLLNGVEKPDFYGFLWKWEALENYQFLARKNS